MKFYTIYETVNKINGQSYIGKHITDNPNDDYLGSGKYLKRAIKKYGIENFEKKVLHIFDNKEDMDKKEAELVDEAYLKFCKTYNLKQGGEGGWDYVNEKGFAKSKEHLILANNTKKNKYAEEWNDLYKSIYKRGLMIWKQSNDPEIKKKRSEIAGNAFKGKHHTKETRKRLSEKHKGKHIGEKNSSYGTCWIYSDLKKESRKIDKKDIDFWIGSEWKLGRKMIF